MVATGVVECLGSVVYLWGYATGSKAGRKRQAWRYRTQIKGVRRSLDRQCGAGCLPAPPSPTGSDAAERPEDRDVRNGLDAGA